MPEPSDVSGQAKSGKLPEVNVLQEEEGKDGYRTRLELSTKEGGWNEYLIRKFLKPDRIRKTVVRYENLETREKSFREINSSFDYSPEQIATVQATPEWQKAKARADKKAENTSGTNSMGGTFAYRRTGGGRRRL